MSYGVGVRLESIRGVGYIVRQNDRPLGVVYRNWLPASSRRPMSPEDWAAIQSRQHRRILFCQVVRDMGLDYDANPSYGDEWEAIWKEMVDREVEELAVALSDGDKHSPIQVYAGDGTPDRLRECWTVAFCRRVGHLTDSDSHWELVPLMQRGKRGADEVAFGGRGARSKAIRLLVRFAMSEPSREGDKPYAKPPKKAKPRRKLSRKERWEKMYFKALDEGWTRIVKRLERGWRCYGPATQRWANAMRQAYETLDAKLARWLDQEGRQPMGRKIGRVIEKGYREPDWTLGGPKRLTEREMAECDSAVVERQPKPDYSECHAHDHLPVRRFVFNPPIYVPKVRLDGPLLYS